MDDSAAIHCFPKSGKKAGQHLPLSILWIVQNFSWTRSETYQPYQTLPRGSIPSPLVSASLPKEPHDPGRTMTYAWMNLQNVWSTHISCNTWHIIHSVGEEESFVILQIVHQAWTLWQENSQPSQLRKTRLHTWVTAFTIRNKLTQPRWLIWGIL